MKWIIIDTKTKKALYGIKQLTLLFNSEEEAERLAIQMFYDQTQFVLVPIKITDDETGNTKA